MPMGPDMPWYAAEVPTVFASLNMPNDLIDVPMVKTAINAHTPTGTHNENVWCGAWDTRR